MIWPRTRPPSIPSRQFRSRSVIGGVTARVFFLEDQTGIDDPHVGFNLHGIDVPMGLPMQAKKETSFTFVSHQTALPILVKVVFRLICFFIVVLPVMLVVSFQTWLVAVWLLIMTAMIQVLMQPQASRSTDVCWASLLRVLLILGPARVRSITSSADCRGGDEFFRRLRWRYEDGAMLSADRRLLVNHSGEQRVNAALPAAPPGVSSRRKTAETEGNPNRERRP